MGLIGGGLALLAVARGRPRVGLFVIALLAATSVSSQVLKAVLAYPRYEGTIDGAHISPAAFPSGHATAAMSLAIALVVVMPRRLRPAAAAVGVGLALAVSFSIVSEGWHFPSDVVGGYLLATGWALGASRGPALGERALSGAHLAHRASPTPAAGSSRGLRRWAWRRSSSGGTVAIGGALVVALVMRPADLTAYAQEHTAFLAVAGCDRGERDCPARRARRRLSRRG